MTSEAVSLVSEAKCLCNLCRASCVGANCLCHLCCVTCVWAIVCAICAVPFALELTVCASCAVSLESEAKCLCHLCCATCVGADCLCYLCRVICVWANCLCHLCCLCSQLLRESVAAKVVTKFPHIHAIIEFNITCQYNTSIIQSNPNNYTCEIQSIQ